MIADANGIPLSWQCHGHYLVVGRLPYLLFISTNHSDYTYFVVSIAPLFIPYHKFSKLELLVQQKDTDL